MTNTDTREDGIDVYGTDFLELAEKFHKHMADSRTAFPDVSGEEMWQKLYYAGVLPGIMKFITAYATTLAERKAREAFTHGQRVGQYQAADKMYGSITQMWLFKDDVSPVLNDPARADTLLKDCEKFMNHNRKDYAKYVATLKEKNNE